ncbi:hypothetical protein A3Q56_00207 [Intoshia linei]|uniref:Uncharacterized protein n=1 Tax=Intoshia linei TaxID=1819745 RepID=A0A177BCJ1_9BILA|nr:hypothetical protein A3Q56_00207 [Intoshia linei]
MYFLFKINQRFKSTQTTLENILLPLLDSYKDVNFIISKNTKLNDISFSQLQWNIAKIQELYSKIKLKRIILKSPIILTDSFEYSTEIKYLYMKNAMNVQIHQVLNSNVYSHNLDHIICRHALLERMGIYIRPKKSDIIGTNPSLKDIMDTGKNKFITDIARVSLIDYTIFNKVLKLEIRNQKMSMI